MAEEELRLNINNNSHDFHLPEVEQIKGELKDVKNIELVKDRIQEIIQVHLI